LDGLVWVVGPLILGGGWLYISSQWGNLARILGGIVIVAGGLPIFLWYCEKTSVIEAVPERPDDEPTASS